MSVFIFGGYMIKATLIVKNIKSVFSKNMKIENVKDFKKAVSKRVILRSNDMLHEENISVNIVKYLKK